jgi:hypothetical protein
MSRILSVGACVLVVVGLIVGPVVFALHQQAQTRNFRVVRAGVLYRGGQMTIPGLKRIFHDYGIKCVICLRDGTTKADRDEEAFCESEEVTFVRIPPSGWGDFGGVVPVEAGVRKFKEVLSDPRNYPVLLHCFAGIHRTGAYTAIYRMEFEHWTNAEAMSEMRACGYATLDEELDILGFMEQYRPSWQPAEPPPSETPESARPQTRRKSSNHSSTVVVTARKFSSHRPARGHKKRSRPARRGATGGVGSAGPPHPGAA